MARMQLSRPKIFSAVAALVALALVVTFLVWQSTSLRTAQGVTLITPSDEAVYELSDSDPIVDTPAGVGDLLNTDPDTLIPLPSTSVSHDGALVRISLFDVDTATTVFGAGAPTLTVPDGSGSSTVLLPILDGGIPLYGDQSAQLRIEVLATFAGDPNAPGSTITLEKPVARADTSTGLAGQQLDASGLQVGVVGLGEVPATGVRAVYVSATVEIESATELRIDEQHVAVPAGVSTITTVVAPDAAGTITVALEDGAGNLQAEVRGWVPEAPQNMEKPIFRDLSCLPEIRPRNHSR